MGSFNKMLHSRGESKRITTKAVHAWWEGHQVKTALGSPGAAAVFSHEHPHILFDLFNRHVWHGVSRRRHGEAQDNIRIVYLNNSPGSLSRLLAVSRPDTSYVLSRFLTLIWVLNVHHPTPTPQSGCPTHDNPRAI